MKLRVILSKEVNTALKAPKRPDRTVDMQMVEDIIKDFFLYGWYALNNFIDGFERSVLLRFNRDGVIIDKI